MTFRIYSLAEIRGIPIGQLREFAREIGVRGPTTMTKEALENAVYARLKEIEQSRSAPSELLSPRSRVAVIDKSLVSDRDVERYGPFTVPTEKLIKFVGRFRPYTGEDGIICEKLVPLDSDIYVLQSFIDSAKLEYGDEVAGRYAISADSGLKMLAVIDSVNGRAITERRAANIGSRERFSAKEPLSLWSKDADIRSLALAASLKKGARILLGHDGRVTTDDFVSRLSEALKGAGLRVISLYLGVMPERERPINDTGATACPFDTEDKYVGAAIELAAESAYRSVEEGEDIALIVDNVEMCCDPVLIRKLLGCACNLGKGSITVFVSANEDIMDRRAFGMLRSVSDACVRFECGDKGLSVDFAACAVKAGTEEDAVLSKLRASDPETVRTLIANSNERSDLEKLLK